MKKLPYYVLFASIAIGVFWRSLTGALVSLLIASAVLAYLLRPKR